jgi:hypothetical protein
VLAPQDDVRNFTLPVWRSQRDEALRGGAGNTCRSIDDESSQLEAVVASGVKASQRVERAQSQQSLHACVARRGVCMHCVATLHMACMVIRHASGGVTHPAKRDDLCGALSTRDGEQSHLLAARQRAIG